jgi:hypothetical protein
MWEEKDKHNYHIHKINNIGQICNDDFSLYIKSLASNSNYKYYLEIGTWNGLGSTKQFIEGFLSRNDNFIFYSLECNKDKSNEAKDMYSNLITSGEINILNEVLFQNNNEINEINKIFPQTINNKMYKNWNDIDIKNMEKCNLFLERSNLPQIFDVILLDGGEFTTYFEFHLLKNRCKFLLLDDINTDKCKLIVKEIRNNNDKWKILVENTKVRNGFMICINLKI